MLEMETDNKQMQNKRMLQCQRVITENNQGGETVWPGVE